MVGPIVRQALLLVGCYLASVRAVQWPADWPDVKAAPPSRPPGGPQVSMLHVPYMALQLTRPVSAGAVLHEGQPR